MKIVLGIIFVSVAAYAGLINGIAVTVNSEPITLYEIDETVQKMKISNKEAVEFLIGEKLQESEVKRLGIFVDSYEIDDRIDSIAGSNNLSVQEFKDVLASKFIGFDEYKENLRKKLVQEKLARKIFTEESVLIGQEDARIYYENNQDEFAVPTKVKITKYASKDQRQLVAYLRNPLIRNDAIAIESETIETATLNPKLLSLVLETKEGSFTPILPVANGVYVSIRIDKKLEQNLKSFEEAESMIIAKLKQESESKAIDRYFKKQRASAKIIEIRLP